MAYAKEDLTGLKLAELKTIAGDLEIDIKGFKKIDIIEAILIADTDADDEIEDDELDDEEDEADEVDDEEEADDDEELDDEADDEIDDEVDDEEEEPEPAPAPKKSKPKAKPKATEGEETLAAKQVAALLDTDPKTLRQFLRSSASTHEAVGSGGRYEFVESDIDKIRTEFTAWSEGKAKRGRPAAGEGKSTSRKKKEKAIPEEEIAAEIEELDDLDDLDDLEDLEDELDDDEIEED